MWAVAKTITTYLNLAVNASCVMNQFRGHCLLYDSVNTTINLNMPLESKLYPLVNGGETFDQFDVELHLLRKTCNRRL